LLERDPKKRLGSGPDDADEIVSHPWFEGFDWVALQSKKMKTDYIPECEIEKELAALQKAADSGDQKTIKQEDDEDAITAE